ERMEITGTRVVSMHACVEITGRARYSIRARMEITDACLISMRPRMEIAGVRVISMRTRMEIRGAWMPVTGVPVAGTRQARSDAQRRQVRPRAGRATGAYSRRAGDPPRKRQWRHLPLRQVEQRIDRLAVVAGERRAPAVRQDRARGERPARTRAGPGIRPESANG